MIHYIYIYLDILIDEFFFDEFSVILVDGNQSFHFRCVIITSISIIQLINHQITILI